MILAAEGHSHVYETEKIVRLFFPFEKLVFANDLTPEHDGFLTAVGKNGLYAKLQLGGTTRDAVLPVPAAGAEETTLCRMLYGLLREHTGRSQPWGILTGVRPAKLFRQIENRCGKTEAYRIFNDVFLVNPKKADLCAECCENESCIISRSETDSFSLYISIPFCPGRCRYCSFVSHSVGQSKNLIPKYLRLLLDEIKRTGEIADSLGLKLSTVYIGGGTPSVLDAEQIESLLRAVNSCFDTRQTDEFTFEAGRPETITVDKLKILNDYGVSRISVNPQSFHDETLRLVNRGHTVKDVYNAFGIARKYYSGDINVDLIAGLENETLSDFTESLNSAIGLKPENITVHTLSVKRASAINKTPDKSFSENGATAEMVAVSKELLTAAGYAPYYMYRQSKAAGNAENVGYSLKGHECLYNVYMMDETHTVLACGASAVTKLKALNSDIIERVFNFKYPYEYIGRFSEIIDRKEKIKQFYIEHPRRG